MPATGTGQQKISNSSLWQTRRHVAQPKLQKLNKLGYELLPHPPYLPNLSPTTTSSSISITFCRENTSTTSRRQKMLSKNAESGSMEFYATRIDLFSWQKPCILFTVEQTSRNKLRRQRAEGWRVPGCSSRDNRVGRGWPM